MTTDDPAATPTARARLREALRPRATRAQLLTGVLCAALGFGIVAQVSSTSGDALLRTARTADLVQLLDDLGAREDRLDAERLALTESRDRLLSGADRGVVAREEAEARARTLGILAGTVPVEGPGVVVRIDDAGRAVTAAVLLDAVQELRDAGAGAIQVGDVRVVASTSFVDGPAAGDVTVDGTRLERPFTIKAVGDDATIATALSIRGGVVDTVEQVGGAATVTRSDDVTVDALRVLPTPRYARPVPTP